MSRAALQSPTVDVVVESALWSSASADVVRRAITAAAAQARTPVRAQLAILLTDDAAVRALNRRWRGIDKPTNVLSFPAAQNFPRVRQDVRQDKRRDDVASLGDIAIAYETVAAEARAAGKPLDHHLAHLAVHGFLHLLGHDHEQDGEAETMERAEIAILARLGLPDPYLKA